MENVFHYILYWPIFWFLHTHLSFTTMGSSHSETLGITAILTITNQMEILNEVPGVVSHPSTAAALTSSLLPGQKHCKLHFLDFCCHWTSWRYRQELERMQYLFLQTWWCSWTPTEAARAAAAQAEKSGSGIWATQCWWQNSYTLKNAYLYDLSSFHSFNWLW